MTIGLDFLDNPIAIHFPGNQPDAKERHLLVIYTTIGMVANTGGFTEVGKLEAYRLAAAPFTIPGIGVVAPECPFTFSGNPDGSGTLSFTPGPFSRDSIPITGPPCGDVVTEDMITKLTAWQGQYIHTQQTSQGPTGGGGGVCFLNIDGYLVVNLSKLKTNFSCKITAPSQIHSGLVAAASFRGKKSISALSHTVLLNASDDIETTAPAGTDDWPFAHFPPSQAIGSGQKNCGGGLATSVTISCNIATLAVTVT